MGPSATGLVLAALGYYLAIGPSLLPRSTMSMVMVGALGALMGYMIGTIVVALIRLAFKPVVGRVRWLVALAAWAVAAALTPMVCGWQVEQQQLLELPADEPPWPLVVAGSLALAALILLISRLVRALGRSAARGFTWFGPGPRSSLFLGGIGAAVVIVSLVLAGYEGLKVFYAIDNDKTTDQPPPTSALRSGSPQSMVDWQKLGWYGRAFVSTGPTPAQITSVTGKPAMDPIRVYIGEEQADTAAQRAELAVRELTRTGAFDRATLVLAVPTGTGLVDPDAVNSAEITGDGNVATVAVQYSDLPSWISFVVDKGGAQQTASALSEAVIKAWRALPAERRPRLMMWGESLGAFGGQGAFEASDQPPAVVQNFTGIVWTGPPAESNLWRRWRAERTGGQAWQPVIDGGGIARVGINATEFAPNQPGWEPRRISFAAHPNDPVVYWDPSLAFRSPDWLNPPIAPTVSPRMRWSPIITFWSTGIDLMVAGNQPAGIAHNYTDETGPQWVAVMNPPGWTPAATTRLSQELDSLRDQGGVG